MQSSIKHIKSLSAIRIAVCVNEAFVCVTIGAMRLRFEVHVFEMHKEEYRDNGTTGNKYDAERTLLSAEKSDECTLENLYLDNYSNTDAYDYIWNDLNICIPFIF